MSDKTKVFVYGTLMSGLGNHRVIEGGEFIGRGRIFGELYAVTSYFPGYVAGEGNVFGEVYEVNDEILDALDYLEGYEEDSPETSMYRRVDTIVMYDNGDIESVKVYLWNDNHYKYSKIITGDFRGWNDDTTLRNLCTSRNRRES